MHNYVALSFLVIIAALNSKSRTPALCMAASYLFYIIFTLNIESDRVFYIAITLQEAILCTLFAVHYFKTEYVNSKYLAYLSFAGVLNHIYGRIVYGYMLDTGIYVAVGLLIVSAQIILMIIRPLNDGIHRSPYRSCRVRTYFSAGNKSNQNMQTQVSEEEK